MKCGTRIALGLAGGYVLGRYKKTRWLALLAAGLSSKQIADSVVQRGASSISSSPELTKLVEQGRETAAAILGGRMEELTGFLHARSESLRRGAQPESAGESEQSDESGESGESEEPDEIEDRGPEESEESGESGESEEPEEVEDRGPEESGESEESEEPDEIEDRGSEESDEPEEPEEPERPNQGKTQSARSRQPESRRRAVEPSGRRTAARASQAGAGGRGRR